jgi:microcystin-dependent protein
VPSPYPATLDQFPGIPYTDNTEYIFAAYATAWANAITAIEGVIGFGSGTSPLNPLYSFPFNQTFATIAARLSNVETLTAGQPLLDQQIADILPVAATASVGNSGKTADARHVHQGVTSYNGRQGVVTPQPNDLGSLFNHPGDLLVGTGAGTAAVLPGTTTYGFTLVAVPTSVSPTGIAWQQADWLPGDVKTTSSLTLPTGWLWADGSAVLRSGVSGYPALFAASTITTPVIMTIGGQTISSIDIVNVMPKLFVGCPVEGPGIPAGTRVTGIATSSVTVSNTIGSPGGSQNVTFLPYGQGDGATHAFGSATTFNVIDMRGRTAVGAGSGPGLTSRQLGVSGGEETHVLIGSEGAVHAHGITDNQHQHDGSSSPAYGSHDHATTANQYQVIVASPGSTLNITTTPGFGVSPANANESTGYDQEPHYHEVFNLKASTGVAVNNSGGGAGHNNMQPFAVVQYLVKT